MRGYGSRFRRGRTGAPNLMAGLILLIIIAFLFLLILNFA